ncbi:UNVERIFIED_CONTAM: protein NOI4 [Sesamum radiatum]|uniref:Protein NOI4 n=1 Tax=Sesamum radiatum TaxID=300843 RepID=A0AAW2RD96_SESRA
MSGSEENVALPKFGSWDVKNPAAAGQYSMIFDRALNQKRAGQPSQDSHDSPRGSGSDSEPLSKQDGRLSKGSGSGGRRWLCCSSLKYAES